MIGENTMIEVWALMEWGWKRVGLFQTIEEAMEFGYDSYPRTVVDIVGPASKMKTS